MIETDTNDGRSEYHACGVSTRTRSKTVKAVSRVAPATTNIALSLITQEKATVTAKVVNFEKFYRLRLIPRREDALPDKIAITGPDDETIYRDLVLPQPSKEHPIIIKDQDPDAFTPKERQIQGPFLLEYTALLKATPQEKIGKRRKSGIPKRNVKDFTPSPVVDNVGTTSTKNSPAENNLSNIGTSLASTLIPESTVVQLKSNNRRRRSSVFLRVAQETDPFDEKMVTAQPAEVRQDAPIPSIDDKQMEKKMDVVIRRQSSLDAPKMRKTQRRFSMKATIPLLSPTRTSESEPEENSSMKPPMFGHHLMLEEPVPPTPPRVADLEFEFCAMTKPSDEELVVSQDAEKENGNQIDKPFAKPRGRRSQLYKLVPLDDAKKRDSDQPRQSDMTEEAPTNIKKARRRSSYFKVVN
ncbi:unnamed protein product, partial [Mesorhabditis belari]|uniref:Uncharacterized protein n=1 Tax=Mesorhabditis belari TaxID=2138241 RepID=A0AAF3EVC7_9BILA